ncbi:O-antigen ligase [Parvibaculum indicum]|uniref:O-antigen ligase family protein n=1 Tax=Parvibaculum indicum TaxID=562969 RepID=UPI00141ED0AB|nr:O-antigen ligase family protein [Parvibaculum indicum]NIJ39857.1 O-antigen ligase [Parvibaculum indicum]
MQGWQVDIDDSMAKGGVHRWSAGVLLADVIVGLALLTSFYVVGASGDEQPAPYDMLMVAVTLLVVVLGLRLPRGLAWPALIWGLVMAGMGIGGLSAIYVDKANTATLVMGYLIVTFIFFTSYVYEDPRRRMLLIFWCYTAAACAAALAGIAGYFGLTPGMFVEWGRAKGTFNDPNVYGPFLVGPTLFLAYRLSVATRLRDLWMAVPTAVLVLGLFLSFSRGAWGSFVLSCVIFFILTAKTARSRTQIARLLGFAGFLTVMATVVVGVALSIPDVAALFTERFSLVQDYDVTSQGGRFEGQARAFEMALRHPLGIGPSQWAMINNLDTHNVYIHLLVAGGFLSGLSFVGFVLLTLWRGWSAAKQAGPAQGLLLVAYAALAAHFAEGFIIDIQNWRHFYLLMGIVWGGILATDAARAVQRRQPKRFAREIEVIPPPQAGFR